MRTVTIGEDLAIEINADQNNHMRLILLDTKTKDKIYTTSWFLGTNLRRRIEEWDPDEFTRVPKPFVLENKS